jgi:hypothetical protein
MITLHNEEFFPILKAAIGLPAEHPDHTAVGEAIWSIHRRISPEVAEAQWAKHCIAEIEKGCQPSEESIQLYENILRAFGPNATGEDLIRFGNAMLKKSEDDPKN